MATLSPVYSIPPVFSVTAPASAGGGAPGSGASGGSVPAPGDPGSTGFVVFEKAGYAVDLHGGTTPTYAASVTLAATVAPQGSFTRVAESAHDEPRPTARQPFQITTDEDPGA